MQGASAPTGRLGRKSFRGLYSRRGDQLRTLIKKGGKQETFSCPVISIVFLFPAFLVPISAAFRHVDPAKTFEQIARDFRTDCRNRRVHYVGTGCRLLDTAQGGASHLDA